jgi:hypothetical protein
MVKTDGRTNQTGTAGIMAAIRGYFQDGGKRPRTGKGRRSAGRGYKRAGAYFQNRDKR